MKRIDDFNSQLNVISSIRLPLILLIVSCHVIPEVTSGTFDWWIVKFIGHEVASIGVPLFFLISGILFFHNVDKKKSIANFCNEIYSGGGKISRRIKSIFIPYMAWNLLAYLSRSLAYRKVAFEWSAMLSHRIYIDWNWESHGFFMYPCDGPLWFMRNLFIICLCAPIVFAVVKNVASQFAFPLITVLFLLDLTGSYDMGLMTTFYFFTLGAYIGVNRSVVLPIVTQNSKLLLVAYVLLVIGDLYCMNTFELHVYIFRLGILLGIPVVVLLTQALPDHYKNIGFPSLSMFIYCAHGFLLEPVVSIVRHSGITCMTVAFIINILGTVLLCIIGYIVTMKYLPVWMQKALMGGRIK